MIYLVTFAFTAFLMWLGSKCVGALRVLLDATGLLLPCLLAGFRDETIGVDVLSYAKWMFLNAQDMGMLDFLSAESRIAAPGWNIFTWVSVNVFDSLPGYLFCIEVLCIVPVYLALKRLAPGFEWTGILSWLLLIYPFSLNGMRQCAAMGIVFYALVYVIERRPFNFVVAIALAAQFHQTALVGLLLYPFAILFGYSDAVFRLLGRWRKLIVAAIAVGVLSGAFLFGEPIIRLLSVLKDSYTYQLDRLGANDFSYAGLYLLLAMLYAGFCYRPGSLTQRRLGISSFSAKPSMIAEYSGRTDRDVILGIILFGCACWQLNMVAATLGRLGYYGSMFIPLYGSYAASEVDPHASPRWLVVGISLAYFIVMVMCFGHEGVVPYSSSLLESIF